MTGTADPHVDPDRATARWQQSICQEVRRLGPPMPPTRR